MSDYEAIINLDEEDREHGCADLRLRQGVTVSEVIAGLSKVPANWMFARCFWPTPDMDRDVVAMFTPAEDAANW